ncbi:MAG: transglutaminase TgpA family protein, partial [Candidatus Dormibacteria bacterium]
AAVTWAVLAAGWVVQGGGGAVVVSLAATAEAALLAQARVARAITLALAPVLALAAIVPTTLGSMPYDGDGSLGHAVARYAGALFGGLGSNSDWAFTVGLCAVLWLCGYWLGWMALRERQGVLAVLPLYVVLATNVLNAHSPNRVALPEGIAVALTLVVIAAAHLEDVESRWTVHAVSALPGMRSRFAVTVAIAVALLTAAAILIPPATSGDISGHLFPGSNAGSGTRGGGAATISFSTGTVPGGTLVSNPQQVLTYTDDASQPEYLRVVDDTRFVAGNWFPDDGGTAFPAGLAWVGSRFTAGSLPRDTGAAPIAATTTVRADLTVQPGATGATSYGLFTGEPVGVDRGGTAFGLFATGHAVRLLTVDDVSLDGGSGSAMHVQTTSTASTASEDQLRAAGAQYPSFVQEYARLTDDGTHQAATIAALAAQWTAGATNPYDEATAIESHLRDPRFFQYTLSPPAVPRGDWAIVYFLTESHRGYCQYFASAMGAMLRSLGIPTRLVNGYGPGSSQAVAGAKAGTKQQVVTTSDAHTWVEAYFPGYGWIAFEPTPSSAQGTYAPFPRGDSAAGTTTGGGAAPTPDPAQQKPGFNDPSNAGGSSAGNAGASAPVIGAAVAGGLLALIGAYLLWLFLPRTPRGAWWRLETVGRLGGARRRQAGETHRQYAERIGERWPRLQGPARELAQLLGRAEFSASGGDGTLRRQALGHWREIARASTRLRVTRRRARSA